MPEPHLRASDADRAAVADVLGTSMSAGRLTVEEYDDRLARAYAARTYADLAELTADLPPADRPAQGSATGTEVRPVPAGGSVGCGGPGWAHGAAVGRGPWAGGSLRAAWGSWLTTAVLVTGIWLFTAIASNGVGYFWPVWVIGPWALVLLAQTIGGGPGRGRQRDRHRERRR